MKGQGSFPMLSAAEILFRLPKRERIKRRFYADRKEAKPDIFDHIEMLYNPKRRYGYKAPFSHRV